MCVGLWKTTAKTWWDRPCKRSAQSVDVRQHVQGSLYVRDHTHTCILDSGTPWHRCWGLWSWEDGPTSNVVVSSAWCWLVGLGWGCPVERHAVGSTGASVRGPALCWCIPWVLPVDLVTGWGHVPLGQLRVCIGWATVGRWPLGTSWDTNSMYLWKWCGWWAVVPSHRYLEVWLLSLSWLGIGLLDKTVCWGCWRQLPPMGGTRCGIWDKGTCPVSPVWSSWSNVRPWWHSCTRCSDKCNAGEDSGVPLPESLVGVLCCLCDWCSLGGRCCGQWPCG